MNDIKTSAVEATAAAKKSYDDYASLQKETLDSLSQAFTLWSKGVEDINKDILNRMQETFEQNLADSKSLAEAKDPQAFFTAQNELVAKAVNEMLSAGVSLSERTAKLAGKSFEPVQKQLAKNWDSINKHFSA